MAAISAAIACNSAALAQAAEDIAEQLDALPQFFNNVTAQRSFGSLAFTVGSFLNMRSLGTNRTLVLLDGARMAPGGVTNFIIDRQFQGVKISTGTGISEYGDGFRTNASIAGGFEIGDRLNVIGSVEARQIDQIIRDTEDLDSSWYRRWGWVKNPAWISATATPNVPRRLTLPDVAQTDRYPYGMITGTGTGALSTGICARRPAYLFISSSTGQ